MSMLGEAMSALNSLFNKELASINSDFNEALAMGLLGSEKRARAEEDRKRLFAWMDYLKKYIDREHSSLGGDEKLPPEPNSRPFPRTLSVMLGDFAAGQSTVDALGAFIGHLAAITLLARLLGLPALEREAHYRQRIKDLAGGLPRELVTDLDDEDGKVGAEKKRTKLSPGKK